MQGEELWVNYEEEPEGSEHINKLQEEATVQVYSNEG